ncbi:hypothetical protein HY483_04410 [Candidatus Woesearchaeota archaeon]|nr:hypothetical protein [Candidatus Woesearchaeota archaeon]
MSIETTLFGFGSIILSWTYVLARKYHEKELTRTFLLLAVLLFVVVFLMALQK